MSVDEAGAEVKPVTLEELIETLRVLREQADEHAAEEKRLIEAAESGEIGYEDSDSDRFDIWESDSENFYHLLDVVERFLITEEQ
jgi:hypothetical protein